MQEPYLKKRPCRICRKWFLPDVRRKGRQKTCASAECKRKWHMKQCLEWNRKNQGYFKEIYLNKKLEKAKHPPPSSNNSPPKASETNIPESRIKLNIPRDVIINETGIGLLIVMEYLIEQTIHRHRRGMVKAGLPNRKNPP